jgi:hypothetical protein
MNVQSSRGACPERSERARSDIDVQTSRCARSDWLIRLALCALLCVPSLLFAQTPQATGTVVFTVGAQKAASPREPAPERTIIGGATVTLASGDTVGTTNELGVLEAQMAAGRVQVNFRAKDYSPLKCQVTVRAGVTDTVRVDMHPERVPAIWSTYGCKRR